MGEKINRLVSIIKDYGRKPYMYGQKKVPFQAILKGGGESASYREQMSKVSEYAVNRQMEYKSSELKKPYQSDGFPDMEHFYSPFLSDWNWGWDDLDHPPLSFLSGTSSATPPVPSDDFCYSIKRRCRFTYSHDLDNGITTMKLYHGPEKDDSYGVYIDMDVTEQWRITGITDRYVNNYYGTDYVKIQIAWDDTDCAEDIVFTVIVAWDGFCKAKKCEEEVTISCDPCESAEPMEWTDSPTVIGASATDTLTLSGGVAPYTYTLSVTDQASGGDADFTGNGKLLETSDLTVSVTTSSLCGYVEIDVVDACGNSPDYKGVLLAGTVGSYTTNGCAECFTCTGLACCSAGYSTNAGPASYWSASIGAVAENGIYQGADRISLYIGLQCNDFRCANFCRENVGTSDGWDWYVDYASLTDNGQYCAWYAPHSIYYCYTNLSALLKRWLCTS